MYLVILSLLSAMRSNVAVDAVKVSALRTVEDGLELDAEGAQLAVLVAHAIDAQRHLDLGLALVGLVLLSDGASHPPSRNRAFAGRHALSRGCRDDLPRTVNTVYRSSIISSNGDRAERRAPKIKEML